ncbi:hypothetical protein SAMN04488057_101273 [Cyclobacterium lianum]|uniref:Uncharacterized protein n=1 Tax=Cyclobacterium lianum TaxID=388280 RepID=A0A1M7IBZ0_9BACT|nr:hypothetical protein [Cyclobacterium lianum]SHM38189.1 hypothetical protein SAMN04488057_101273 [Cyclobacterium lianum]
MVYFKFNKQKLKILGGNATEIKKLQPGKLDQLSASPKRKQPQRLSRQICLNSWYLQAPSTG